MLIKCIIERKRGSTVEMDGKVYRWNGDTDPPHVCEVKEREHVKRLLAVPSAFEPYELSEKKPKVSSKKKPVSKKGPVETAGSEPAAE